MITLTKAQRSALKRVYDREPIYPPLTIEEMRSGVIAVPITYRQFLKGVQPGSGCVMIYWKGMWLGIEPDGYTHS